MNLGPENQFRLQIVNSRSFKQKSAAEEITYRVRPRNQYAGETIMSVNAHLLATFEAIIEDARRRYGPESLFRLYINHPVLNSPMVFKPQYLGNVSAAKLLEAIEYRITSAGDIPIDGQLIINIAVCKIVQGGGRTNQTIEHSKHAKRSIVQISNDDSLCLPRAIVVGEAHAKMLLLPKNSAEHLDLRKKFKKLCDKRRPQQKEKALDLMKSAGVDSFTRDGLITDIPRYELAVGMNIVVLSTTCGNAPLYKGCGNYKQSIFLYHSQNESNEGHFDVITKMGPFLGKREYCHECLKGYNRKQLHSCRSHCNVCGRDNCPRVDEIRCDDCNRMCRSMDCLQAHKRTPRGKKGPYKGKMIESMCKKYWQCMHCSHVMKSTLRVDHICGETLCQQCGKSYEGNYHPCYVRNINPESKVDKMLFYDFECTQDDNIHEPNLVVVQSACNVCKDDETVTQVSTCTSCGSRCSTCGRQDPKTKEFVRDFCVGCGVRQRIFAGERTVDDFCSWLLSSWNAQSVVIAHNAKAYDNYFIFQYLVKKGITPKPIIMSGSKIMYMKVMENLNITFLDSINFLPMGLAKLPKSFGLSELRKGFFPHLYNRKENQNKVDSCHPPLEMYSPDTMSGEGRKAFLAWYEKNKDKPFDLQKEMVSYCISDVDILRKACCRFQKLVLSSTGKEQCILTDEGEEKREWIDGAVDPFSCMTIASVCMKIFRSKFVPETWEVVLSSAAHKDCTHNRLCKCPRNLARRNHFEGPLDVLINDRWVPQVHVQDRIVHERFLSSKIALLPNSNVLAHDICSREALEWLRSIEISQDVQLQTALSPEGEKRVKVFHAGQVKFLKLDGFFESDESGPVAFEYNGCSFHGCPSCFPTGRHTTQVRGKSLHVRYQETKLKEKLLKDEGFSVITKWQCEFTRDSQCEVHPPINLKDCYFGGRTNALVLHKKMEEGEKAYYFDFTSLYPSVLKYQRYPVGHPVRIDKNFAQWQSISTCTQACQCEGTHLRIPYFGVMKVTVLPPQNLHIPVLPHRVNGKLKFPLCLQCAEKESKQVCTCPPNKREFTGTFCTPELEVAINCGYKVSKVHEVLHWSETEIYNKETKDGGLFTEYINTFLKLKQEASGYPEECDTEEQQRQYVTAYKENEGITLDREKIEKNPGLRSLSKLALNSFYGKFGQRDNLGKSELVNTLEGLYERLLDKSKEFTNWHIMTEDVMMIEYITSEKGFDLDAIAGNVVIAAFCTCWARLQLFRYMKKLGERVLYHDTDSIIFTAREGEYIPPTGQYLGDFTDELACKEVGCDGKRCKECSVSLEGHVKQGGHWISEFVACGPKNYAYKLNTGEVTCKVRGFSLNYQNSQILNFETMKKALLSWHEGEPEEFETVSTMILRAKHKPEVYTKRVSKRYNVVYDKRCVKEDLTTRPFGYSA